MSTYIDLSAEHISLIYNLCDNVVISLKDDDEYTEDQIHRELAEQVIQSIDTHSDAFQPNPDQILFIKYLAGVYTRATSEIHATTDKMDDKLIAWEEYALGMDLLRRLRNSITNTH